MVRFIEGVEHAAMGAETLERHRGLAENDEHHALAMEASQLLDRHFGGTPYPISREYFKSLFEPNTRQQPVLIRSHQSESCDLLIQPSLCHAPIASHGPDRDTENLSGFLPAQIPKEPEFHDPPQPGVFLLKLLKGLV